MFMADVGAVYLELTSILRDFYGTYRSKQDADNDPPLPLTQRLNAQHLDPRRVEVLSTGRPKPGSRAPGDTLALSLAMEIGASVRYWTWKIHPTGQSAGVPRERWKLPLETCLKLLPGLANGHDLAEEIRFDMRSVNGQALIRLGLKRPPVPIRDLTCPYCGAKTIVFDPESEIGDVWCSSPGPEGCHNDLQFPECRALCAGCGPRQNPACPKCAGQPGLVWCRRSGGSQRHAYHWSHGEYQGLRPAAETAS